MTIGASDFADTLRLLLPGFVCMKVFYWLGLRTKRSDAQWVLWSILAAGLVSVVAAQLSGNQADDNLLLAFVVAVSLGLLLAGVWQVASARWPGLAMDQAIRSWDVVFMRSPAHWTEVITKEHGTFLGQASSAATSVESDDLDVLLTQPTIVNADRTEVALPGVESVLIRREDIAVIYVYK